MISVDEIVSIELIKCNSKRYDITVEDNHNFFANGILVHNCQNLTVELEDWKNRSLTWESTEKLDGTSMTVFFNYGYFGVCSRNWELTETETNSLWRAARAGNLDIALSNIGKNIALQGELIGEGIQGNPYKIKGQQFFIYDIFDIDQRVYFDAEMRVALARAIGVNHVPIDSPKMVFSNDTNVGLILKLAEGKSTLNISTEREGLVFKCIEDPSISFKAISNRFLIKHGD